MDTNFTLISQLFKIIEHFTFLPLDSNYLFLYQ